MNSAPAKNPKTLLLVDDNERLRTGLAAYLGHLGYRTLQAADAPSALAVWETASGEIALVITDLVMSSEMDGRELANHLHLRRPDLPIILTSGYLNVSGAEEATTPGLHFVQKPFRPADLVALIEKCLASTGR